MRRLASDVLRELEMRVARLEKQAGNFEFNTMYYSDALGVYFYPLKELKGGKIQGVQMGFRGKPKLMSHLDSDFRQLKMKKETEISAKLEKKILDKVKSVKTATERLISKRAKDADEVIQGKDFVLRLHNHPTHVISITEMPSKGMRTVRFKEWTNLGWIVRNARLPHSAGNNFMVENLMRDASSYSRMTYDQAQSKIERVIADALSETLSEVGSEYSWIENNTTGFERNLKANAVKPIDYREYVIEANGFTVKCKWDYCTVSLHSDYDEAMHYNEGMVTHYKAKTDASSRNMWKIVHKLGESGVKAYKSGEDFMAFLKKKKVSLQYVPTVYR